MEKFDKVTKEQEQKFWKEMKCYRLTKGSTICRIVGLNGTMSLLDKKIKSPKLLEQVIANPKTYLDTAKKPLIRYGCWTCNCETEWLRTPFNNFCSKCNCDIGKPTNKALYLEEVKF